MTADNPGQQGKVDRLEPIIQRKMSVLQQSIDLETNGEHRRRKATRTDQGQRGAHQLRWAPYSRDMFAEENGLLSQRVIVSTETYHRMRMVLGIALAAVVLFLLLNFGRLLVELMNRSRAEAAVRRLSSRILQLQDTERRRIARELHDGVAQYFASAKMTVDSVFSGTLSESQKEALTEASRLAGAGHGGGPYSVSSPASSPA